MSKQDRQVPRTPADLERKYTFGKRFAEFLGIALDAQKSVEEVNKVITSITEDVDGLKLNVKTYGEDMEKIEAELELTIKEDENGKIVSMLNAAADIIALTSNRLSVDSTYFKLTPEGEVTATKVDIKSEGTDSSVNIGNGKIGFVSPATYPVNMDDTTSKALLMTFKVFNLASSTEYKEYGLYAYGEWWPTDDETGWYWHSSGTITVEEIAQGV